MSIRDAFLLAANILKQVMEESLDEKNTQFASISREGFAVHDEQFVKSLLNELSS